MSRQKTGVGILLSLWIVSLAGATEPADGADMLAKVRDKLKTARSYRIERKTTIGESKGQEPAKPLGEMAFVTIGELADTSDYTQREDGSPGAAPLEMPALEGRFRFELTNKRGKFLLVGDGEKAWWYSSADDAFREGDSLLSLSETILGPVLSSAHIFPFLVFAAGNTKDAKLLREEEVAVAGQRRECFVISSRAAMLDVAALRDKLQQAARSGKPVDAQAAVPDDFPKAIIAAGMNFSRLLSRGYWSSGKLAGYATPSGKETPLFTEVTVWIDKERLLPIRIEMTEPAVRIERAARSCSSPVTCMTDGFGSQGRSRAASRRRSTSDRRRGRSATAWQCL
jgi:hypothetical protein